MIETGATKTTFLTGAGDRSVAVEFAKFVLRVQRGPDQGAEATCDSTLASIGTSASCDLVLTDETVSRRHCEIRVKPHGFLLHDLGSTNGTYVSGLRTVEAYLAPTAAITIGQSVIDFIPLSERVLVRFSDSERFGETLGTSIGMREMFYVLERVSGKETTVLLIGETGTGKEVIARSIHANSPRRDGPFIVTDCSTLIASLAESELFGHVKGAFTGADRDREGVFEAANGGTLFLDEIGEMPLEQQAKLLRVLEDRSIRRVGGTEDVAVDVRVVAATNRELRDEVAEERFRQDLYYRLGVVEVRVPPLRQRRDDVPLLVDHFLQRFADRAGKPAPSLPENTLLALMNHTWPGNVRELRNALERAYVLSQGDDDPLMDLGLLTGSFTRTPSVADASDFALDTRVPLARAREEFERAYLIQLLADHDYNVTQAAKAAGVRRQSLQRMLRRHGIRSDALKRAAPDLVG